jgi:exopolysaccharide biosynthesis polyprenyl glycosylphosphotransferase
MSDLSSRRLGWFTPSTSVEATAEPPHAHEVTVTGRRSLSYLALERGLALAVAVGLTAVLWDQWPVVVVPLLASVLLAADTAALPAYERTTSLRPARRLVTQAGAGALLLSAAGWLSLGELRILLASVALVLAVPVTVRAAKLLLRSPRSTLLVGDHVAVNHLIAQWKSRPEVSVVGICLTSTPDDSVDEPREISGVPVLGRFDDVALLARDRRVDQVVVAPGPVVTAYDVRKLSWALEGSDIELSVAAEVHGAVPRRIEPRLLGRRLLLSVRPARPPLLALLVKDGLDRLVATLLLVLVAPVLMTLVLAVRWDSSGPGIFRQVRAGKGGRPFTMYKVRTMSVDAEERLAELRASNEGAGPLFKMAADPRITRIGRVLRRTSLDELPQLFNVVAGHMSLIGPRPALPSETNEYDEWIRRRLRVKPGMTGLWQVSGRSSLTWNESVRLDLDYVDNLTLVGDLKIAARTVTAVVTSDGAS